MDTTPMKTLRATPALLLDLYRGIAKGGRYLTPDQAHLMTEVVVRLTRGAPMDELQSFSRPILKATISLAPEVESGSYAAELAQTTLFKVWSVLESTLNGGTTEDIATAIAV